MGAAVAPSAGAQAAAEGTRGAGGRGARCMLGVVVAARCSAGGVVSDRCALPGFVRGGRSGAPQCEGGVREPRMLSRDELGWNMCPVRRG